ncbi:MAG: lipopolysaccharide heptosyltransferase II [Verrucomicrobia bacterium]|nr:lipopolysaccharide heptosyltransferase II [Verrucomicrobiota bacterium]
MEYFVYLIYRAFVGVVTLLPLALVYRLGQAGGWLAYVFLGKYRQLARRNLTIAFGDEKPPPEVAQLTRTAFQTLGANLLSSLRAATLSLAQLRAIAEIEGMEKIQAALDRGRGVVLVLSHLGNWELFAQLCQLLPQYRWSTVFRPLGNQYIDAHVRRTRAAKGVVLFERGGGFHAPTAYLRAGGAVGVLVDQHAGDGGVWTPFFGRLASTSNLAALLALRTGAALVPIAVHTAGVARWRVVISPEIDPVDAATGEPLTAGPLTARINVAVERQVRAAPADWFWVHDRWKTPKPKFLLADYRRGIVLEGTSASALKPFRILVRSTNWLGDAVMAIPTVQAISRGRPDARVTVLAPAKLAELWQTVPGVAEVLAIPADASVFAVAKLVRRAGWFDATVLLPNSWRAALEVWLAGVRRRVGYAGHGGRERLLNQIIKPRPAAELAAASAKALSGSANMPEANVSALHQRFDFLNIARQLGAEIDEPATSSTVPVKTESGAVPPRFALCPGAEYGAAKRWPAARFAEAARRVAAAQPCEWVLLGTAADAPLGEEISRALAEPRDADETGGVPAPCENLIGKTSLAGLIETLRGCALLLTNDTGTMHLAAWLGVPVVAIFGSTEPRLTAPVSSAGQSQVRVLRRQVACSPCFLRECPLDLRCMTAISPADAAAAVMEVAAARGK